jgi:hypothetical protein
MVMKRILAGLIGGVALAGLALGTAAASGDDHYEGHEAYEHGRAYYNPSGYTNYGYTNYGSPASSYRHHERYEYNDDRYRYNTGYNTGVVYPNANVYGNAGYRNHEMYEYGR